MVALGESPTGEDVLVTADLSGVGPQPVTDTISNSSEEVVTGIELIVPEVRDPTDPLSFKDKVDFVQDLDSRLGGLPATTRRQVIKETAAAVAALLSRLTVSMRVTNAASVSGSDLRGDVQ